MGLWLDFEGAGAWIHPGGEDHGVAGVRPSGVQWHLSARAGDHRFEQTGWFVAASWTTEVEEEESLPCAVTEFVERAFGRSGEARGASPRSASCTAVGDDVNLVAESPRTASPIGSEAVVVWSAIVAGLCRHETPREPCMRFNCLVWVRRSCG